MFSVYRANLISAVIEKDYSMRMLRNFLFSVICFTVFSSQSMAENLDKVLNSSEKKVAEAAKSQKKIDQVSEQTQSLFDEYKSTEKLVEDLKIYNKTNHEMAAIFVLYGENRLIFIMLRIRFETGVAVAA